MKDTWSVINSLLNKPSNDAPLYFLHDNEKVSDPQTIANKFNSYFMNCCKDALSSMSKPSPN